VEKLIEHPWIKYIYHKKGVLSSKQKLKMVNNLYSFSRLNAFQRGVMELISGLTENKDEIGQINAMFNLFDKDKSGDISLDEVKAGMTEIVG
jgi:Ca2+-binding EF-hand superfamily protein